MSLPANARPDRIVVVDDDARIRDLLRRYLAQEGFDVLLAEDSKALNRLMTREHVDLIVLDLMLPGEDGLSICRRLRAANDATPIIMLTAKVEDVDRIVGLEVGADDYLPKPFNPRELLARIHAVLRRRPTVEAPGAPSKEGELIAFGPFEFDCRCAACPKTASKSASPRVSSPCSRPWCAIRASRSHATSWRNWPGAASSSPLTAAWTCKSRAYAKCSNPTRRSRATSKRCGVWVMFLCPMAPTK
jgi:CheY-like chemotaxis protein